MHAKTELIDLIRNSHGILVFTGAGISTGSGIPDFRGPNGVWKTRQPVYYQDFMTSEHARIEHWDYKLEAAQSFRDARPNTVHRAVAQLEASGKLDMVVTQNIDGLHQRAGTTADHLVELHGTNAAVECQACLVRSDPEPHFEVFRKHGKAPLCDLCGGYLKIATISFGQKLRSGDIEVAERAAAEADLAISLGSTLSVYPASSIPLVAAERGTPYVIINRGPTEHDAHPSVTLRIEGDVLDIFPPAVAEAVA